MPLPIDNKNSADRAKHEKIVFLTAQILEVKKQLASAQSDRDKDFYSGKSESLDRQIDALVYELYGLTEDEIRIVEGAAK